jgi:hypothetical protein
MVEERNYQIKPLLWGIQMGEIFGLGWLTGFLKQIIWADSLLFPMQQQQQQQA